MAATPGCQQILSIFARGSGQPLNFREAPAFAAIVDRNIADGVRFESLELGDLDANGVVDESDYPANDKDEWFGPTSVWDPNSDLIVGKYNASRQAGTDELVTFLNARVAACPGEVYVLGGYSQGADAVGAALPGLSSAARAAIGYIALFGDPEFNPFGAWARGDFPWYTVGGVFGPRVPYIPGDLAGRVGSWCDKSDGICQGNPLNLNNAAHGQYPDFEMQQAANEIAITLRAIRPELRDDLTVTPIPISLRPTQNVDVTFVVDTTGSMGDDIDAAQTSITAVTDALFGVAASPRVALVNYKDLGDPYQARVDAPFTADRAAFAAAVNTLGASGGGDYPESVYSGLMTSFGLDWRPGALKLAIVIGDAPAHNPEPGTGYTLEQVLRTAFELDPVVINPIVVGGEATAVASFTELADGSGGQVFDAANAGEVVTAIEAAVEGFSSAPVAQAGGPYVAAPGDELTFTGAGSFDPAGAIVEYAWDFDADGVVDQRGDSPVVSHTYPQPFTGLASLTVTNVDGRTNTATAEVTVAPGQQRPQPPAAPTGVQAVDAGGGTVTLSWQPPANAGDSPIGGFRVSRSDGVLLGVTPADQLTLDIAEVPTDADVSFQVRAVNEFGLSEPATSNTLRPSPGGPVAPAVDIKPGSADNPINLRSRGVIPVALLSADGFEATAVDYRTLCFGDAEAPAERDCGESHGRGHVEDANSDGRPDLVLHFNTQQTGIDRGDSRACVNGRLPGGDVFEACDVVRVR
ncbi:hypothetical protein GCM10023328_10050 [Modestobacter marinus]|uniref:Mg-chelatase subunit ChlD n=1 Tax=Modestobacter marinus TaxID=477641 RepID=A0A846LPV8_9ACTN|nr:cutinase family protein [Modestobacter marinus]NIH69933.1 Mg-chelatase subunit ChlD [Modestobacter marinus]GGL82592.1 hypothetical protein GCM10011589_43800 [Modestobacter marinus]